MKQLIEASFHIHTKPSHQANILNRDELKKKINGQIPRCLALVEMDLIEISPSLQ